jgi:pyridoxal phosphate enzyme (YggS family)
MSMSTTTDIERNLDDVRARVVKAGGDLDRVRIVAVTKTFPVDVVRATIDAGVRDIGENYAQEAASKASEIASETKPEPQPTWHFIGQLQRNKVKLLAPFISVWHTVDSARLAQEIARRAPGASVFVQVNATSDEARGGCLWRDVDDVVGECAQLGLDVRGLMGVASMNPGETRPFFKRVVETADRLRLPDTSIGMSGDYEVAVQEGATVLRLGSALFGRR